MTALPALETIRRRAEDNAYALEALDWSRGVDRQRLFFPEHLTPLFHTPAYQQLAEEERRTYNQLYAQAVNEQFIFLEDRFLLRFLADPERLRLPADLTAELHRFVAEEVKHTEMFRRLARLSDPVRYAGGDFHFLRLTALERRGIELMARFPRAFAFWALLAVAFEEKTVDYFRQYEVHRRERPDRPLDPLYYDVHRAHMLDEVRHVQVDHHLVHHLWDRCRGLWRAINLRVVVRTMRAYTRPKRTHVRVLDELCRVHPRLAPRRDELSRPLLDPAVAARWQQVTYSRRNVPQTFALFEANPDLRRRLEGLIEL